MSGMAPKRKISYELVMAAKGAIEKAIERDNVLMAWMFLHILEQTREDDDLRALYSVILFNTADATQFEQFETYVKKEVELFKKQATVNEATGLRSPPMSVEPLIDAPQKEDAALVVGPKMPLGTPESDCCLQVTTVTNVRSRSKSESNHKPTKSLSAFTVKKSLPRKAKIQKLRTDSLVEETMSATPHATSLTDKQISDHIATPDTLKPSNLGREESASKQFNAAEEVALTSYVTRTLDKTLQSADAMAIERRKLEFRRLFKPVPRSQQHGSLAPKKAQARNAKNNEDFTDKKEDMTLKRPASEDVADHYRAKRIRASNESTNEMKEPLRTVKAGKKGQGSLERNKSKGASRKIQGRMPAK
ncbi:hypothetical protein K470DRAFT_254789 [Piedraia hortae CBS 480.64]|uniref:Uncharacterized protein n=1 Tax=Piedraia hortae CBS 480.64 TaxID=1314780 RepID=A0A6A7C7E1_9PEZI|nr:hypothetical protein K470DRAFT_254789 [Piedraia hortae CBS 480.64]